MTKVKKADLESMNIPEDKLRQLKHFFPEVFTEGLKVDPDKLRLVLGENVDTGRERFGMNWPGKADCFKIIQAPSVATLILAKDESINCDKTNNLFIEGDNLEVLKLLQKSYYGKVKMIYIDPPYNTGREFIYPDNYKESLDTYLRYSGQIDDEGRKYSTNAEADGRFHSKWLNMMYPRLYLSRNLLRDDGIIFISIGEDEINNLSLLCNEIFGIENLLGVACRVAKRSNNKGDFWAPNFDYILTYAKNHEFAVPFFGGANEKAYDQIDTDGPRKGEKYQLVRLYMSTIQNRNPEQRFWIECPDGSKVIPPGTTFPPDRPALGDGIWRWTRTKFEAERDKIVIKEVRSSNLLDGNKQPAKWNVFTKTYLNDVINNATAKPNNLIEDFINQIGSHELGDLEIPFDYPKPAVLIQHLMSISKVSDSDIVLDFFSGSCSTAHAVLAMNQQTDGSRKFIMVQLPEPCDETSEAFKAGYKTIADIGKERIRRVIKKIKDEQVQSKNKEKLLFDKKMNPNLKDLGFKVFKLAQSNFKVWDGDAEPKKEAVEKQLEMHVDHINPKSSQDDILFELLLKAGFELTTKIDKVSMAEKTVYSVEGGLMLICLEKELTKEVIKAMAEKTPSRVICLDQGFAGNDQLKTNAVQIMKSKGIEDFRTV